MDSVQLAHLLRRTEYVARPARMNALSGGSVTREMAVNDVLNVTTPVAIPAYIEHDIDGEGYNQWVFAVQWWLDRMVDSPKPMQERMAFFWHGHFCSSWEKVNSAEAMMAQNRLFRDSAFGNFREMTQAMSIQPAMLFYLDNLDNVKSSPNQNFARELLELFTLGVVDENGVPNYSEDDVTAAVREQLPDRAHRRVVLDRAQDRAVPDADDARVVVVRERLLHELVLDGARPAATAADQVALAVQHDEADAAVHEGVAIGPPVPPAPEVLGPVRLVVAGRRPRPRHQAPPRIGGARLVEGGAPEVVAQLGRRPVLVEVAEVEEERRVRGADRSRDGVRPRGAGAGVADRRDHGIALVGPGALERLPVPRVARRDGVAVREDDGIGDREAHALER